MWFLAQNAAHMLCCVYRMYEESCHEVPEPSERTTGMISFAIAPQDGIEADQPRIVPLRDGPPVKMPVMVAESRCRFVTR